MANKCIIYAIVYVLFLAKFSYAESLCRFTGSVDLLKNKFNVALGFRDGSSIVAELTRVAENSFHFGSMISHVKTPIFDISSVLESSVELTGGTHARTKSLRAAISSKYSLINYKPARELTGYFEIQNDKLSFNNLSWNGFVVDGSIGLISPFDVRLSLRLLEVDLSDLTFLANCESEDVRTLGAVSGRIDFSGTLDRLALKGKLSSLDGEMGSLAYESITINFDGLYPIIQLKDSQVVQKEGLSFNIDGNVDLTEQCNFMKVVSGIRISPLIDEKTLYHEWTIKRNKDSNQGSTEFKYRLQKSLEGGSPASKEDSDMLSVEHNIKF